MNKEKLTQRIESRSNLDFVKIEKQENTEFAVFNHPKYTKVYIPIQSHQKLTSLQESLEQMPYSRTRHIITMTKKDGKEQNVYIPLFKSDTNLLTLTQNLENKTLAIQGKD